MKKVTTNTMKVKIVLTEFVLCGGHCARQLYYPEVLITIHNVILFPSHQ